MMRLSSSWRRLYSCIRIPGGESKYLWVAAFNLDAHRFAHAPASLPTVVPGAYCCSLFLLLFPGLLLFLLLFPGLLLFLLLFPGLLLFCCYC